jgi:hypothetical protein
LNSIEEQYKFSGNLIASQALRARQWVAFTTPGRWYVVQPTKDEELGAQLAIGSIACYVGRTLRILCGSARLLLGDNGKRLMPVISVFFGIVIRMHG